jgi:isoquinoline 1-oxidoreductase alpha subunit
MISFTLNGKPVSLDVSADTPLLWALRESAGLTGTKFGCGVGACGACTVHLDGAAVRSCVTPVSAAGGRAVTTIEGLARGNTLHPVQTAWIDRQVPQCGYCQSGMIMAVAAFLDTHPSPSDEDIDRSITNICRCGTYERIRKAIHAAAERGQEADHA